MQTNSLDVVGIWIWDSSTASSINGEDPGSSWPILSRVLSPKLLSWKNAMSFFFFIRQRKERERMKMVEMAYTSHWFSWWPDQSLRFSWQGPAVREIDCAWVLTWFAQTFLPLVVSMAGVRSCLAVVDPESNVIFMSCSLHSSPDLLVHTQGDSFLKASLGMKALVNDLRWWGIHNFEAYGHLFGMEGSWCEVIKFLHVLY